MDPQFGWCYYRLSASSYDDTKSEPLCRGALNNHNKYITSSQFNPAIASLTSFILASDRGLITHLNGTGCLRTHKPVNLSYDRRGRNPKTQDVPDVRLVELWLELLAHGCFDVEHSKGRSNVEEQGSESEPPSRTHPITSPSRTDCFEYRGSGEDRTVCPFQKSYLRDPLPNDPASRPSGTVQDRMCAAQGIRFHRSRPPYTLK